MTFKLSPKSRLILLPRRAILPLAFLAAVFFVVTIHAQTTQTLTERLRSLEAKQAVLTSQVERLEASNIEHRLSTEEADLQLVLKLTYVVIGGVFVELVLQAFRLRSSLRETARDEALESEETDF